MDRPLDNFVGHDLAAMPSSAHLRVVDVPGVIATPAALRGFGQLVDRFDPADVTVVPWPTSGSRPLVPGTGVEGGVVADVFAFERRGSVQYATNRAVGRSYLIGWLGDPAHASDGDPPVDPDHILTHEANYHPDGGQIFWPRGGAAFVALLALPGDGVQAGDFRAFWFDGSRGVHIHPGVWHQPVFPVAGDAVFDDAQGRVHACVSVDFVGEWGAYLRVPLRRPR